MRASSIVLAIMILSAPAAGALVAKVPAVDVRMAGAFDPSDAELVRLLAREIGLDPPTLPLPTPATAASLPGLVQQLSVRVGTPLSYDDVAVFAALDPRVAAPAATMLVAMDHAWTLRDAAFEDVAPEDLEAARRALIAGENVAPFLTPDQQEMLVASAIMLMDTLDTLVIPQLQALNGLPVWPPIAVADPAGILFIGSAGDDVDTIGRLLSIDGGGNDEYRNYIGGADLMDDDATPLRFPGAVVAVELAGDDRYLIPRSAHTSLGAAFAGVGIMKDLSGEDFYSCGHSCLAAGDDEFDVGDRCFGSVATGIVAVSRDDSGDDVHLASSSCYADGEVTGIALYWDRTGLESYTVRSPVIPVFGFAEEEAKAWYVNDGPEIDTYQSILEPGLFPGRCNDCTWTDGRDAAGGRGNDNFGGLPYLLSKQDAL